MYRNIKGWSPLSAVAQDTESTSAYIQKTMHFESEIAELLFKAVLASKVKISKVIVIPQLGRHKGTSLGAESITRTVSLAASSWVAQSASRPRLK